MLDLENGVPGMLIKCIVIAAVTILLSLSAHAEDFQNWETRCTNDDCRSFTITWVNIYESRSTLLLLEISPTKEVLISALDTEETHYKFYTDNLPVELVRESKNYVPAKFFFATNFDATLTVDGKKTATFRALDESHLLALSGDTDVLVEAFKRGSKAVLLFGPFSRPRQRASFSLIGFTAAYTARSRSGEAVVATSAVDPVSVVSPLIAGNRLNVEAKQLHSRENPFGDGFFVYIPERYFIWFVKGQKAVKLNGRTNNLTPALPFPSEASYKFWRGTGLSASGLDDTNGVTRVGIELVFEQ